MIYAKKLNTAQRKALQQYENICGFEPMHQDDLDTGEMSFKEVWWSNQRWLEDVLAEVVNINTVGCGL